MQISKNLNQAFDSSLSAKDYESLFEELKDSESSRKEAREACYSELSKNSKNPHARLILARLFYIDKFFEFSIRELVELKKYSKLDSLDRLIGSFGNYASDFITEQQMGASSKKSAESKLSPDISSIALVPELEEESEDNSKIKADDISDGSAEDDSLTTSESSAKETKDEDLSSNNIEDELETIAELDFDSDFMDVLEDLDDFD